MRFKNPPWLANGVKLSFGTALLLGANAAYSATLTVDSAADTVADDASCTLREAVAAVNAGMDSMDCLADDNTSYGMDDTIVFSVGTVTLTGGGINITAPVTVDGAGSTTIDANQTGRIFSVDADTTLNGLTLTNGSVMGENGGAVTASAMLTVTDSTFTDNEARGAGASGGAIFSNAAMSITGGSMSGNFAQRAGGAIELSAADMDAATLVSITGGSYSNNSTGEAMGDPGNGGVLHVTDAGGLVTVNVTGGSYTGNTAFTEGGALWNFAGTMTVDGSTITGNTAQGAAANDGGGGIFNNGGTLNINSTTGPTVISGNNATGAAGSGGGIFNNGGTNASATVNVDNVASMTNGVTISGNSAPRAGGGIETLAGIVNLYGVVMDNNTAGGDNANPGNGGAVHVSGAGTLNVYASDDNRRSTISNNTAAAEGGGLWFNGAGQVRGTDITGNSALGDAADNGGGGIFDNAGSDGTVSVFGSTITGNTATVGAGSGGGVFISNGGSFNASASLISGNTANRAGGGIEAVSAQVDLTGVVLSGNNAASGGPEVMGAPGNGGGMHVSGTGANTNVRASLVADNVAASEGGGLWNAGGSEMTVDGTSLLRNTAAGASATEGGGALFQQAGTGGVMNVSFSRILLNSATGAAGSGGGIFVDEGGELDVDNSVIAGNSANRAGGGVENNAGTVVLDRVNLGGTDSSFGNMVGTNPGNGGGLHTTGAGSVDVNESLVGYNTASEGGGLWNSPAGTMVVANTTVSNNQATGDGGGIYQQGGDAIGTTEVAFSTVTQNSAGGIGGGLGTGNNAPVLTVDASIIAENSDSSGAATNDASDDVVFVGSDDTNLSGNNLIGANGGFDGNLRLFGPAILGEGTGLPTAVHPLLADADAVDQAACDVSIGGMLETADVDQRRVDRPQGADCDLGAFEFADIPALTVSNTSASSATVTENSEDVVVVGMTLQNNGMDPIDVGGFAGSINVNNLPATIDPSELLRVGFQVYSDDNGNGMLDDGEMPIDAFVSRPNLSTLRFQVGFATSETLDAGASASYIVVATDMPQVVWNPGVVEIVGAHSQKPAPALSWQTPAIAGGALLGLLSLVSVGRIRRRTRVFLLATSAALVLTGCGGGGGGGGGGGVIPDNPMNPLIQGDIQFVVDTLLGGEMDPDLIGDGLPVNGPGITIQGLPETQDF